MGLPIKIAWRYFIGKKSAQAINVISWISMVAIMLSTAAMIILFSVFNGIESITKDLFTAFYPDLKIQPKEGKFIVVDPAVLNSVLSHENIDAYSKSIEDMALLANESQQKIARIKGVSQSWFYVNAVDKHISEGTSDFNTLYDMTPAVVGGRIAQALNISSTNFTSAFTVYYPKAGMEYTLSAAEAFSNIHLFPIGQFKVEATIDDQYVIVPYNIALGLFNQPENAISSIDIAIKDDSKLNITQQAIQKTIGDQYEVLDRYEQNKTLYMIIKTEKWAIYAILVLVLLIASFNLIGSLSMLVLEKRKDISIFKAMGANKKLIFNIFLQTGLLITGIGAMLGLAIGFLIALGQQQFEWIKMGEGFIVDGYPVAFKLTDFILILFTVGLVGFLAAYFPAAKASKQLK